MSTLASAKAEIEQLSGKEFWELAKWFDQRREDVWDREIEADARPGGPLDKLARKALKEHAAGLTVPLEKLLRDSDRPVRRPQSPARPAAEAREPGATGRRRATRPRSRRSRSGPAR